MAVVFSSGEQGHKLLSQQNRNELHRSPSLKTHQKHNQFTSYDLHIHYETIMYNYATLWHMKQILKTTSLSEPLNHPAGTSEVNGVLAMHLP